MEALDRVALSPLERKRLSTRRKRSYIYKEAIGDLLKVCPARITPYIVYKSRDGCLMTKVMGV